MDENENKEPKLESDSSEQKNSFEAKSDETAQASDGSFDTQSSTETDESSAERYNVDEKYKKESPFTSEGSFDSRRDSFDSHNQNSNYTQNRYQGYNNGQNSGYNSYNGNYYNGYNGNNSGYNRYNGYGYYPPYQSSNPNPNQNNPKKKSKASLIAVCSFLVLFVLVAMFAFGYIYTEYIIQDDGVTGGNGEQTPGGTEGGQTQGGSVTQGDFNIQQSETPGAAYSTLADAYEATRKTFVEINTVSDTDGTVSAGSGVIIARKSDNSGYYIVTNNHVVEGATTVTVRAYCGNDYKQYTANSTILTDENTDLAVIFIAETAELQIAKVGKSANLRVGEDVYVIGNPLGTLAGTMTNGIISAQAVEIFVGEHNMELIQTNTAINPGNSGGPMFNMSGELVGIVNAKYSDVTVEGIGFAIPIDIAKNIVEQMISKGYVEGRHDLGISVEYGIYYGRAGLWITGVDTDSALRKTDLTISNSYAYRIDSINGYTFESTAAANIYIDSLKAGDTMKIQMTVYTLSFSGNGSPIAKEITITLGQKYAS